MFVYSKRRIIERNSTVFDKIRLNVSFLYYLMEFPYNLIYIIIIFTIRLSLYSLGSSERWIMNNQVYLVFYKSMLFILILNAQEWCRIFFFCNLLAIMMCVYDNISSAISYHYAYISFFALELSSEINK